MQENIVNNDDDLISEIIDESVSDEENSNSVEGDEDDELGDVKVTKDFKENVIKFVKLDELIKKKQEEITELKSKKNENEEYILKYLDTIGENTIDITDGKLKKNKSETKTTPNIDCFYEVLDSNIKDDELKKKIKEELEKKRQLKVNVNLKRINTKKKPVKKKKTSK